MAIYRLIFFTCLYSIFSVSATSLSVNIENLNPDKFVNAYHKFYKQQINYDLFASHAEHNNALELRQDLLNYIYSKNLKVQEKEIDLAWQDYLQKNFKRPSDLEKKLQNAYSNLSFTKEKFIENLDLEKYFTEVIRKNIIKDFNLRKKILKKAQQEKITVSSEEFNINFNQFVANLGGPKQFKSFLNSTNLNIAELSFYIKSELLKKAIVDKVFLGDEGKLNKYQKTLNNRIKNFYLNANQIKTASFYFTLAFIDKDAEAAKQKITKAQQHFLKQHSIHKSNIISRDIEIHEMQIPVNLNSNFYRDEIKSQILELAKNDVSINNPISMVFTTELGYYIAEITNSVVSDQLSFETAYNLIYQKDLESNLNELEKILN